jgi:hypothetical protein
MTRLRFGAKWLPSPARFLPRPAGRPAGMRAPGVLTRYTTAAALARLADEGSRVALLLQVLDTGRGAAFGGLLVGAAAVGVRPRRDLLQPGGHRRAGPGRGGRRLGGCPLGRGGPRALLRDRRRDRGDAAGAGPPRRTAPPPAPRRSVAGDVAQAPAGRGHRRVHRQPARHRRPADHRRAARHRPGRSRADRPDPVRVRGRQPGQLAGLCPACRCAGYGRRWWCRPGCSP